MHGLGVCRSSPFFRICVRNSDEYLVAVPLVQGVEQWILSYAILFSHVGFPRLFLFVWVGEEGYNGGILDRDPVKLSSWDKEISTPKIVCILGLSTRPCSCVRTAWLGKSPSVYLKV